MRVLPTFDPNIASDRPRPREWESERAHVAVDTLCLNLYAFGGLVMKNPKTNHALLSPYGGPYVYIHDGSRPTTVLHLSLVGLTLDNKPTTCFNYEVR